MRDPFLPVHILFWSCLIACNDDHPGKNKDSHQDTTANDTMQTDSVRLQVRVFSKTEGFHHASIADGNEAILQLGVARDFEVEITTNAAYFTDDSLQQYAAVVFLSTTGDVLNATQEAAFERYIQSGGGYVGIHAASDTEYEWSWYGG